MDETYEHEPACRQARDAILDWFAEPREQRAPGDFRARRGTRDAIGDGPAVGPRENATPPALAETEAGPALSRPVPPALAAHLARCPSCAAFYVRQQALDARLQAALVPPALGPTFRTTLRARLQAEAQAKVRPRASMAQPSIARPSLAPARVPHAETAARPLASRLRAPRPWHDALPDIVHFGSFAVATLACAAVLPFDVMATLGAGTSAALLTYVLLTTVRDSFDAVEQPDLPDL